MTSQHEAESRHVKQGKGRTYKLDEVTQEAHDRESNCYSLTDGEIFCEI